MKNNSKINSKIISSMKLPKPKTVRYKCPVFTKSRVANAALVGKTFFPTAKVEGIDNFVAFQSKLIQTRGLRYAVERSKECTLFIIKRLAGIKYNASGVKVVLGIPIDFQEFNPGVRKNDIETMRYLISLYTIYRHVTVPDDYTPDLSSITKSKVINKVFENEFRKFVNNWAAKNGRARRNIRWTAPHLTASQGPNGKAIWTSILDRQCLTKEMEDNIRVLANSEEFDNYFNEIAKVPHRVVSAISSTYARKRNPEFTQRRLCLIKDKYYKGRVIAMGDYWSQSVLKPYHLELNKILKENFFQDCTFNQTSFKEKIFDDSNETENNFYSVDLSNATDEFPIGITKIVIEEIFGKKVSDSWQYLMTDIEFTNPWGPKVKYTKGQPMGMYSSWPAFAVSHNLVLKFLSYKNKIPTRKGLKRQPYVVLGDDIVITDSHLYKHYSDFLHMYEVPVNLNKTLISTKLCEFAKRLVSSTREELSPFPINAIEEESKGFIQFSHFIREMEENRGLPIKDLSMPEHKITAKLYMKMSNSPNLTTLNKRMFNRLSGFNKVLRNVVLQRDNYSSTLQKLFNLCKIAGIVYSCNTNKNSLKVITLELLVQEKGSTYMRLISDTVKAYYRLVKDIGVVLPTNRTDDVKWMIEYLPLLSAYRHNVRDIQEQWDAYRQLIIDGKTFEAIKIKSPLPIISSDRFLNKSDAYRERVNFNFHETVQVIHQAYAYYNDCSNELIGADAQDYLDSRLG